MKLTQKRLLNLIKEQVAAVLSEEIPNADGVKDEIIKLFSVSNTMYNFEQIAQELANQADLELDASDLKELLDELVAGNFLEVDEEGDYEAGTEYGEYE
tara:strand:- start:4939 stop:5235 length:297 start_codon:yes stop_codon:yes gene_type:complete